MKNKNTEKMWLEGSWLVYSLLVFSLLVGSFLVHPSLFCIPCSLFFIHLPCSAFAFHPLKPRHLRRAFVLFAVDDGLGGGLHHIVDDLLSDSAVIDAVSLFDLLRGERIIGPAHQFTRRAGARFG